MGYSIESADRVARAVFSSEHVQRRIAELLCIEPPVPPEIVRSKLHEPSVRRAVNAITHPRILEGLRSSGAHFFEIPLLIETCLQGTFDRVWVVTCGMEEQRQRLMTRLGSDASVESIIGTQLTSRTKIPFGDRVIRTNQAESSVKRFVTLAAQQDLR